jgi:hypothetical protein
MNIHVVLFKRPIKTLDRKTLPSVITRTETLYTIDIAIYEPLCFEHDMKYAYKPLNVSRQFQSTVLPPPAGVAHQK